jgi:hypothetical protein
MLPGFRFLLGATLAVALMGVVTLGLVTTVRLSRQAAIGRFEISRSFAYAEPKHWNRSVDPELTRVFEAAERSSRTAAARAGAYDIGMRVPAPASTASDQQAPPARWSKEPSRADVLADLANGALLPDQVPPAAARPAPLVATLPHERIRETTATSQTAASEILNGASTGAAVVESKPSEITSEPSLNDSADRLVSLPAPIVTLGAVEEREVAEFEAEPVNVLPRPRPKSSHMIRIPPLKAKAHAVRKVRAKARAKTRAAPAAQRWPTASSGYQLTPQHQQAPQRAAAPQHTSPQQPPGWGWGFQ